MYAGASTAMRHSVTAASEAGTPSRPKTALSVVDAPGFTVAGAAERRTVTRFRDALGKFVVSAFQIGSGASLGREGPTVHICSGVASAARQRGLDGVICGHIHRAIDVRFGGTIACTTPAPAHQIALDLAALGADFYAGNCHKWMMAPKGAAFLHVRRDCQAILNPAVISHGWTADGTGPGPFGGTPFIDRFQVQGTRDPSPFLTVPATIAFAPPTISSAGWNTNLIRPANSSRCFANSLATPSPIVVCPSWPQACIFPGVCDL